jgi:hypothetical protein
MFSQVFPPSLLTLVHVLGCLLEIRLALLSLL